MKKILSGIDDVSCFVDDIIIYSEDKDDHLRKIDEVLSRLASYNVVINSEKSSFCTNSISYRGFGISKGSHIFDKKRLKDFELWKRPNTKKQIQSLLGLLNWYRPYIPNLSTKIAFLYEKIKKKCLVR